MKSLINISIISLLILSCDNSTESEEVGECIDGVEIELWDKCYNIEETTELNLSDNGLTGEIPSEIGNLINLTYLSLRNNKLAGGIPTELGNLINLNSLDLSINQFGCKIVEENEEYDFFSRECLEFCNEDNGCNREIPSSLGNLSNLDYLDLMVNRLNGDISIIVNFDDLYHLRINQNEFSGNIPEEICDFPINFSEGRSHFNISSNYFCPIYPECLMIGEEYIDSNNNGVWDEGEEYIDSNENEEYDENHIGTQDTSDCP